MNPIRSVFARFTKVAMLAAVLMAAVYATNADATLKLSSAARTAMAQAIIDQIDAGTAGKIEICTGSIVACSADADGGCTGQTLLAELTMSATSGTASTGTLTFSAITDDSSANNTGTAGYFMVLTQTGGTCVYTGTVGTSGADLNLNTTSIVSGARVSVTAASITMPNS